MLDILMILAEETTTKPAPSPFSGMLPLFLIFGLIFYFLMIRPQSKEKKRRQAMLTTLTKNDRVVTIGGIVGTVSSVRDDEVTLKVDESSNTKITFSRSAVQKVMRGTDGETSDADSKK